MAEDIKNLIEKIHQEGVQAAEDRAREIEEEARQRAKSIIEKAQAQAQAMVQDAGTKIAKREESEKASLKQAGRDLLLGLRKEISDTLYKLIESQVSQALSTQELAKILSSLIEKYSGQSQEEIVLLVSPEDKTGLDENFFGRLPDKLKKGITLKSSEDINKGFIISYDAEKSQFDFTDKALAEYLSLFLQPRLAEILKELI